MKQKKKKNNSGNSNPNWKGGITKKKYFCKNKKCKKQIHYITAVHRSGFCFKCRDKIATWTIGISNTLKKKWKNKKFRISILKAREGKYNTKPKAKKFKIFISKKRKLWFKNNPNIYNGKSNPNYIDGRSKFPYTLNFSEKIKELIRKRDKNTCQNCGISKRKHKLKYECNLSIHHIDYDKKNCKENNLITLCLKCNSSANANRPYWKKFYKKKIKGKRK